MQRRCLLSDVFTPIKDIFNWICQFFISLKSAEKRLIDLNDWLVGDVMQLFFCLATGLVGHLIRLSNIFDE